MYPGKPLPKKNLRPFWFYPPKILNSDEYTVLASSDRTIFLGGFSYVFYIFSAIAFIGWVVLDVSDLSKLYTAVAFLIVAILLQLGSSQLKPKNYINFNRAKNYISVPKGLFSKKNIMGPWEDWTARLSRGVTSKGAPRNKLLLIHIPTTTMWELDSSIAEIDSLLGYWSFIVQFMSGGPYPNVPPLQDQKNLTDGLGIWDHWDEIGKYESDLYREWLQQLKADPSLDIAYRDT